MIRIATLAGLGAISVMSVSSTWNATLDSQAGSKVTGTATVERLENNSSPTASDSMKASTEVAKDSIRASVSIKGGEANASHAWHIHSGTCASVGPVAGAMATHPMIQADADGSGTATVTMLGNLPSSPHVVAVHQGTADTPTIACGDLRPTTVP